LKILSSPNLPLGNGVEEKLGQVPVALGIDPPGTMAAKPGVRSVNEQVQVEEPALTGWQFRE